MSLVMGICEGIAVLNFGQIIAKGTPEEIQSQSAGHRSLSGQAEGGREAWSHAEGRMTCNVYYGSIHAIKGISFEVNEGEIVTLIGANGAGKSTTLNTISRSAASLAPAPSTFEGRIPAGHRRPTRSSAMGLALRCPEGRRVFLQMTVEENLEMGAYTRPNGEIAELHRAWSIEQLSPPEGAPQAGSRHPVRRRAADAGHGPRPDEPAQAADAG